MLLIDDRPLSEESRSHEEAKSYQEFFAKIVKANREIFVLNILSDKPMCGYDLIKEIFGRYDLFLSQGAVYPILYSMENEGILRAEYETGNMRSKIYSVTPVGRVLLEVEAGSFVSALNDAIQIFKK